MVEPHLDHAVRSLSEPPIEDRPVVAVIIPAYRAETHIRSVLAGIPSLVQFIVVVDDASPDHTSEVIRAWGDPRVHLVRHAENQGVGGAVLTGYEVALRLGADIIVKMDSDDQMDPAYLPELIAPIIARRADYTKGNRFVHTRHLGSMPLIRRIGNLGLSFLTKLASGYWNIFDPTNGYTAIHASVVPLLKQEAIGRRYFYESSMLLELSILRAVVCDVYIPAQYGDEISSLSVHDALFSFPPRLLRGFGQRLWIQYFVRDFSVLSIYLVMGLLLTLFGFVWGTGQWIHYGQLNIPAPTGTVMLAVLPTILGLQLLLQAVTLDIQNSPTRPIQRSKANDGS